MTVASEDKAEDKKSEKPALSLAELFEALLRHTPEALDAYLVAMGAPVKIIATEANARCHILTLDGNGRPRVRDLARKLRHQIVNYCIPRSRIEAAVQHYQQTGSAERMSQLEEQARHLFTDIKKTGEGGEVLLYLLAEGLLGYPQLLCKMPLKTRYTRSPGLRSTVKLRAMIPAWASFHCWGYANIS